MLLNCEDSSERIERLGTFKFTHVYLPRVGPERPENSPWNPA
ncbi:hypothetical protein CBM2586_A10252 [Cupriavidus phytorum]|uniref:Uncharacterized protein n=1 Tax=Cupriavidus taiwanensis TaxID=164546 RepID=A0A975WPC9_9BURK|nr:hypothetical protein CBM2586_A10252 [Cupriavidus taiwanensis]